MRRTVHSISAAAPALKSVLWPTCFPRPSPTTEPFVSSSVCSGTVSGNRLRPNPHCSDNAACAAFCSQVASVGDDCDSFGKPSSDRSSAGHPDSDPYTTSAEPVGGTLRLPGTRHCHDCCAFDACRRLPAGGATSSSGYPIFDAGSGDSAFRFPSLPSPTMARSTFGPRDTLARVGGHHHRCQVPARRGWYTSTPKMHMSISCQVDVL